MVGAVQDASKLNDVCVACQDVALWGRVDRMYVYMLACEQLRIWDRGCTCHGVELLPGKTVECCWKRRRLPELASRVDLMARQLSGFLDELTFSRG